MPEPEAQVKYREVGQARCAGSNRESSSSATNVASGTVAKIQEAGWESRSSRKQAQADEVSAPFAQVSHP